MKLINKAILSFLCSVPLICGAIYTSCSYAIDYNDYALDVTALSDGNDDQGVIPVFVIVTYQGAGVDILTAQNFSTKNDAQLVPAGCSSLTLDDDKFHNKGDGTYHLGLRPVTALCAGTYFLPIKVDARPGLNINASGIAALEIFRFSFDLDL